MVAIEEFWQAAEVEGVGFGPGALAGAGRYRVLVIHAEGDASRAKIGGWRTFLKKE